MGENEKPSQWTQRTGKDAEAVINALRGYAMDDGIAWDAKKELLTIKNTRRIVALPNPWNEAVEKVWTLIGVEGYSGDGDQIMTYQGKNGLELATVLQEAGLTIDGLPQLPPPQLKR